MLDRDDLDLYDEEVVVEFAERLRPTLRFQSIDELVAQMSADVDAAREILARHTRDDLPRDGSGRDSSE